MKLLLRPLALCLSLASFVCLPARGQFAPAGPTGGSPGMMGGSNAAAIERFLGDIKSFSAEVEVKNEGTPMGTLELPMTMTYREGRSRMEMDMTRIKGGGLPPEAAEMMKQMGMDRTITISLAQKKVAYFIYPGLQAFAEIALPGQAAESAPNSPKPEITELGKESVDGHPCVKNKVLVAGENGAKHEATLWNATDLKNFPVKMELADGPGKVTLVFKKVKFDQPGDALFLPPSGYEKYPSVQALMQGAMMKRLGGGGGFPGVPSPPPAKP